MSVRTLKDQGELLRSFLDAMTTFEKTEIERRSITDSENLQENDETVDIEDDTRSTLTEIADSIQKNISLVLSSLKRYKSEMTRTSSFQMKKLLVDALNDIQSQLKQAYVAIGNELAGPIEEQQERETLQSKVQKVRAAYNKIVGVFTSFLRKARQTGYTKAEATAAFDAVRKEKESIQNYFPQLSPFGTGTDIDKITENIKVVFENLLGVIYDFRSLGDASEAKESTLRKFRDEILVVSNKIIELFGKGKPLEPEVAPPGDSSPTAPEAEVEEVPQ